MKIHLVPDFIPYRQIANRLRYFGNGLIISTSSVRGISSPTMPGRPLTPKSWRLILAVAEVPIRRLPHGSFIGAEGTSASRTTSFVTPCIVRSPVTFSFPSPAPSTFFETKVMVGYFCTSRKFGLRRSLSRMSTRVSTEVASIVAWIEDLPGLAGSYFTVPLTLVNAPRTVETPRCRTENCADECGGSSCHVSCAAAVRVRRNAMAITSEDSLRDMNLEFSCWLMRGGYSLTNPGVALSM